MIINIKQDRLDPASGRFYADIVAERLAQQAPPEFLTLFASPVLLVPVPGSGLTKPRTVWPAKTLCGAFHAQGLGDAVAPLLQRVTAVPKSAGNPNRPNVEAHVRSFAVTRPLLKPTGRLLLIDDVVTRGATLLGAARVLAQAFPHTPVDAFALARVQSDGDIARAIQPCLEYIRTRGDVCFRRAEEEHARHRSSD